MYRSPIETYVEQTRYQIREAIDQKIVKAVQDIGINIDKRELEKALQYDRDQYEKGYKDRDNEIVRCGECKYEEDCSKNIAMRETYEMYEEIEWCSFGERKGGDTK